MSLSTLICDHLERLIKDWNAYASNHVLAASKLPPHELEDSARSLFHAIAEDMETPQTAEEQFEKSVGNRSSRLCPIVQCAEEHADHRLSQGFSLDDVIAEFRAARASVMRLWMDPDLSNAVESQQIVRFNEAIDEAIGVSLERFNAQLDRSRDLFLGVLGHDMRTPLGAISLSSKILLKDDRLSLFSAKAATRIYSSGVRLTQMLDDLLDFTRTRLGKSLPVTLVEGDMGAAIGQVVEELRAFHPTADIQFETSGDVHGRWDFGRLSQVISNLGGNAIQHGDKAHPITIKLAGLTDYVTLTVANKGAPIPTAVLNRIFDPLTRASDSDEKGSIGLGLYISQQIALAHQGSIDVSSDINGTIFTVTIPRYVERRRG